MADPTPNTESTGAIASVTGFFSDVVKTATPAVQSYFDYRAASQNAKTSAQSGGVTTPSASGSGANWKGTVATGSGITSQPWFPYAIGAVVILTFGLGALVLLRSGKK